MAEKETRNTSRIQQLSIDRFNTIQPYHDACMTRIFHAMLYRNAQLTRAERKEKKKKGKERKVDSSGYDVM
jgi:hypothetical protein